MKKRILSLILAICLIIPCAFMLTACGKDKPDKTMSVSINPKVSFVVDSKNKIVSVMYENEDAGTIYADVNFVGMKADDAVEVLIQNAVITGHFEYDGETISLSVNGCSDKDITELENLVKDEINEVCASLGVEVTVAVEELTEAARKQALVASAMILAPEKTQEELNEMSNKELINLIEEKQKELKGLVYSQVETIKSDYGALKNAILQGVKESRDLIASQEAIIEENEAKLENLPDGALKDLAKKAISDAKALIKTTVAEIDKQLENYEENKQKAINDAKKIYANLKASLVEAYNNQVAAAKTGLKNHLDAKLAAGTITQEQYNYWMNLSNNQ